MRPVSRRLRAETRPPTEAPLRLDAATLRQSRVAQAAVVLIALHLGYRIWITSISWYVGDDFSFMSRMWHDGPSLAAATEPYAGHLMPGGLYLTWLAGEIHPYDFTVAGAMLVAMQALADIGLLVLLVRMFGLRPGILPPLALYLFTVFSTPMAVWWAAGVNQIPMQVVLFWSLAAHVSYLRTRERRHLLVTIAWLAAGLVFYEKTVLVLGAIGIVSLSYFATGSLRDRVRTMWEDYRAATLLLVLAGAGYLGLYATVGLNFSASEAGNDLLGGVATNMAFQAYAPAVVGGPLAWTHQGPGSLPDPGALGTAASVVVIVLVVRAIHRARLRSLRAWWLPAFFLGCDIALVLAGRASLVGDIIALEYRYQSELGAATALALALATLPVRGAVETVEPRAASRLLDVPARVTAAIAAVCALGLVSSTQFATYWSSHAEGEPYFANLLGPIKDAERPVPLVDTQVPTFIMWGLAFPANLQSRLLAPYADRVDFRTSAVDTLMIAGEDGTIGPVRIAAVRKAEPGPREGCGWNIFRRPTRIPLDGPVAFGGWWVRIHYLAAEQTAATVTAGSATYDVILPLGEHVLYVAGRGDFDSITLARSSRTATLCTDDITVGRPQPQEAP
ncbi:hypothetical protein [Nocardioides sp.]|uniref:hypothetical protein n=1 Tax=Nocardioides sp. TaxID=35761 RepID=UPI002EDB2BD5